MRIEPEPRLERSTIAVIGLVAANIGFLIFYFAYDLSLYQVVIVYWLECLWIGAFSVLKLFVASLMGKPYENKHVDISVGANLFLTLLAVFYLGGAFLSLVFAVGIAIFLIPSELAHVEPMALLQEGGEALILGSVLLSAGHGLSFIINFLIMGEFRTATAGQLLGWPFKRSLALLGAIIIALALALLTPRLATTTGFAVVLIGLKLLGDFRLFLAERRAFAG